MPSAEYMIAALQCTVRGHLAALDRFRAFSFGGLDVAQDFLLLRAQDDGPHGGFLLRGMLGL